MKRNPAFYLLALVIFVALNSCRKENSTPEIQPESAKLFNIDDIPEIRLQFTLADWNKLLSNYDLNPKNETNVVSKFSFTLNGSNTVLDSIGVKLRGNTSRRRPEGTFGQAHNPTNADWNHCHFGLDFTKYKSERYFNGLDKLILKWFKDDANYVREIYCYDLFKRYNVWTAARASYCKVSIYVEGDSKPAYYGVYSMIEQIDAVYIAYRQKFWGPGTGNLWKCTYNFNGPADLVSVKDMGVEDVKLDPSRSKYYTYDLKTNKSSLEAAKTELSSFINDLNSKTGAEFEQWIAQKMDVDLFLKTYAVNVLVGMWDDYWANGNNYYLYFSPNGKVYFIPYDYDNTLGTSLSSYYFNSGTQDLMNWGRMNQSPLISKILQIEKYRTKYQAYISELTKPNLFNAESSMQRINQWQTKIAPFVANDTGEDMVIQDLPAGWGNESYYRLLSGDDQAGKNGPSNYFKTRIKNIPWLK
ncbi:MAG: hypothetical protein RI924_978 [Bacteroidota bacterium]|jgi:spore coat protein CotH